MLKARLKKLLKLPVELILPTECVACGASKTWLCDTCYTNINLLPNFPCAVCHLPTELGQTHKQCKGQTSLTGIIIASSQSNKILKQAIHDLKYGHLQELAQPLSKLLIEKIQTSPILLTTILEKETIIVPVPLHDKKKWDRGYNQAELLAQSVATEFNLPLQTNSIKRIKNTKSQTDLPRPKRLLNMQGVFQVTEPEQVKKKNIILVDDVMTTGATLNEVASVFKSAGAREVWAAVLTRG